MLMNPTYPQAGVILTVSGFEFLDDAVALAVTAGRPQYVGYNMDLTWGLLCGPPATDRTHWKAEPDGSLWLHEAAVLPSGVAFAYELIFPPDKPLTPVKGLDSGQWVGFKES